MSLRDQVNDLPAIPEDQESGGGKMFSYFTAEIGFAAGAGKLGNETFQAFPLADKAAHDRALDAARDLAKAEGKRAHKSIRLTFPLEKSFKADGTPVTWSVASISQMAQHWMRDTATKENPVNLYDLTLEALEEAGIPTLPYEGWAEITYVPDPREGPEAYQERKDQNGAVVTNEKGEVVMQKRLLWLPTKLYKSEAEMRADFGTPASNGASGAFPFGANLLEGLTIPEMFSKAPQQWAEAAPEILAQLGPDPMPTKIRMVAKGYYNVDVDGVQPIIDLLSNRARFEK